MKNGFALITCLAVVIVIAIATAGILQAVGSHANMKANTLQEVQAKYLAEAGMENAIWKCRAAGTGGGGGCGGATYSIEGTNNVIVTSSAVGGNIYNLTTGVDFVNQ
jgi:Tfp pilus assembly protein PilX